MSRFHRHSRITPHRLYRAQVARAWGSFALLLPIAVLAALPLLLQQVVRWGQSDRAALIGIPYQAAETVEPTAEAAPAAPVRRVPPTAAAPPAPPLLFCTDTDELPLPEAVAEAHLTDPTEEISPDDADDPAEALAALSTPARPAPAVQQKPAAAPPSPAPHSGTDTALAAATQTPPAYRSNPRPPYPAAMRQRRLTGSVGVRIHISAEGTPTAVDITAPSGHSDFDRTTQSWILQHWRFHPATADGAPIASSVKTRVDFTLEN